MENYATQNQIRLLQNIAGLSAVRMFTNPLCLKTLPLPLTNTDYQAGL